MKWLVVAIALVLLVVATCCGSSGPQCPAGTYPHEELVSEMPVYYGNGVTTYIPIYQTECR